MYAHVRACCKQYTHDIEYAISLRSLSNNELIWYGKKWYDESDRRHLLILHTVCHVYSYHQHHPLEFVTLNIAMLTVKTKQKNNKQHMHLTNNVADIRAFCLAFRHFCAVDCYAKAPRGAEVPELQIECHPAKKGGRKHWEGLMWWHLVGGSGFSLEKYQTKNGCRTDLQQHEATLFMMCLVPVKRICIAAWFWGKPMYTRCCGCCFSWWLLSVGGLELEVCPAVP